MRVSVDCREVRAAVTTVRPMSRSYGADKVRPIRIVADDTGRIVVRAGVIDVIEVEIAGTVTEAGSAIMRLGDLADMIRGRREVEIVAAGGIVTFAGGGPVGTCAPVEIETDGPCWAPCDLGADRETATIPAARVEGLVAVLSTDDTRPILTSLRCGPDGFAATDSYRLVVVDHSATALTGPVLVPRWALVACARASEPIVVTAAGREFHAVAGPIRAAGRLMDGEFPNYQAIVDGADPAGTLTVNVDELRAAVKPTKGKYATIETMGEHLVVTAHDTDGPVMAAAGVSGRLEYVDRVTFARALLIDLIDGLTGTVSLRVDPVKPALVRIDANERRLLMPIRTERAPYDGPEVPIIGAVRVPATPKRAAVKRTTKRASGKRAGRATTPTVRDSEVPTNVERGEDVIATRLGEIPTAVADYLDRLVYAPKRDYAAAWAAHVFAGGDAPADPERPWADKVRDRIERYRLAVTV